MVMPLISNPRFIKLDLSNLTPGEEIKLQAGQYYLAPADFMQFKIVASPGKNTQNFCSGSGTGYAHLDYEKKNPLYDIRQNVPFGIVTQKVHGYIYIYPLEDTILLPQYNSNAMIKPYLYVVHTEFIYDCAIEYGPEHKVQINQFVNNSIWQCATATPGTESTVYGLLKQRGGPYETSWVRNSLKEYINHLDPPNDSNIQETQYSFKGTKYCWCGSAPRWSVGRDSYYPYYSFANVAVKRFNKFNSDKEGPGIIKSSGKFIIGCVGNVNSECWDAQSAEEIAQYGGINN